jgi:SAM-dependent methyltransferase
MSQDAPEPQNIYDDPAFFAGYSRFERFGNGWTAAYEHPAFMSLLPDPAGLRVADLGCGAGQLAHYLAERGAADVTGIDLSERMLEVARRDWSHPHVRHLRQPIEDADFPPASVDLVVSSLAFHYVADYDGLMRRIATWLVPGGNLVFSTEHPVYLSRATEEGWVLDANGEPSYWALDRYGDEGLRVENWVTSGVRKYHRMVSTLINGIADAGMLIERVVEPMPDAQMLASRPERTHESKRPFVLLVRAAKP